MLLWAHPGLNAFTREALVTLQFDLRRLRL
jgi:hypothetical protein